MHTNPNELKKLIRRGRRDPVFFSEHLLGIPLHKGQKKWIRNTTPALYKRSPLNKDKRIAGGQKRNILVPGNRYGKTVVTMVKHIWYCYYKVGLKVRDWKIAQRAKYQTLNMSPHSKQVSAGFEYVRQIFNEEFVIRDKKETHLNKCRIKEFFNAKKTRYSLPYRVVFNNNTHIDFATSGGNRAVALAGTAYAYISYDEAPSSYHLEEELQARITSRLIDFDGSLDLVGTPDYESPSHQFYYHLVRKGLAGEDGWYAMKGAMYDNTFLDSTSKQRAKRNLENVSARFAKQVLYGDFVTGEKQIFNVEAVKNLFDDDLDFEKAQFGHEYLIGVDWSFGADFTCIVVLDITTKPYRIVEFLHTRGKHQTPTVQFGILKRIIREYNNAEVAMDTSSMGGKICEKEFEDFDLYPINIAGRGKEIKRGIIRSLVNALHKNRYEGIIRSPRIRTLEEELRTYHEDDKKLRQDCVMALGFCTYKLEEEEQENLEAFDMDILT